MDNDDKNVGQIYSRREAIKFAAQAGLVLATGTSLTQLVRASTQKQVHIVVSPELTEGPFFVDEKLKRSNIAAGTSRPSVVNGLPLVLSLEIIKIQNGIRTPLPGVHLDVWHADAIGVYSDESNPMNHEDTSHQNWLRGYQVTDSKGEAKFQTVFPGWYEGRAPHIHFKVRSYSQAENVTAEFTSQLFFHEKDVREVYSKEAYMSRGSHSTTNENDGVYNDFQIDGKPAGSLMTLDLSKGAIQGTYHAHFAILVDDSNLRSGRQRRRGGSERPPGWG